MYSELKERTLAEQVETMTRKLVSIPSVNGTEGEANVADFIKQTLQSFPYFTQHPLNVWEQPIPGDPFGRKNIFALIHGKSTSRKTIIFHSHMDTVGIEDFGSLKKDALNPDALQAFFENYTFDQEVQQDARSGDWLFGRGAVDMQSGIAVHLANVLYFSEHLDELPGNILLMFNPDEESQHVGVQSAISELKRLSQQENLEFVAAINDDFITPLYDGDTTRYIYTGAAGKLLPCFYIFGREVHVGDTLTGIDPNVIASEFTRRIHNNLDLAETIEGELCLPPTCLYQRDTKEIYNVQTAKSSYLYFNYFIYERTAKEVMDQLKEITIDACSDVEHTSYTRYQTFLKQTGLPPKPLFWNIEVTTLADYIDELERKGIETTSHTQRVIEENKGLELRMLCFKVVEALQQLDPDKKPRVILFFAPPYLPHNYLKDDQARDRTLLQVIEKVVAEMETESEEIFAVKKFFPYLADGSFLSLHETDEEILSLIRNIPEWDSIGITPFKDIRELNIASINMGVYGKDGHQWTERVFKPYTFHVLPKLIRKTTIQLLTNQVVTFI
ncbi:peptidase M20 [Bacillus sp. MUM 116]|uniref:M20/M25/M40 family metallo-hydrolase n=1 Tax=Bacillus sp. MUM 116 TaxID=1678002 RepID=UPI0008F5AC70|nr:M20/M25/M40 family metallo-hydrolase [Bacillus sp. MUM 116]OIK10610.1 peptidase M20 [Bacillus sp. MUM 116]